MSQGINDIKIIGVGKDQYSASLGGMISGRILPWVQDSLSNGYPAWTEFDASQREVFILDYEGNIETSFDITPYNPLDPEDVSSLTNLILSYRESEDDCDTDEVELWGECYNISETTNITLTGNPVTGTLNLGEIPPAIGDLINLDTLSCEFCGFTGSIPPEIGNLTNLKFLRFNWSGITGSIPPEIGNLISLQNLILHSNQLTGSIPPEIGELSSLRYLNLTENYNLTGSIPPEIGNLINLIELNISDTPNQLTGGIPSEIGNLINLEKLSLFNNQLSGSIPPEIGNLISLQNLILHSNQLTGSIPTEIGGLTNLNYLRLSNNQLSGSIPTEIENLVSLLILGLNSNQLTGEFPEEIYNLDSIEDLFLNNNQFSGELPSGFSSLINLERLDLSYNQFGGEFPEGICELTNLSSLDISNNQFCSYPYCFYDYYLGYQDTTNCGPSEYFGPIWYVSNAGSDENGNGSEVSPFASIQKGIESAVSGDTVVVSPGMYSTNNAIYDKNIVLGSMFLTTGDTSFISSTIIDGGEEGCPLMIYGSINDSCRVTGFTIQNGTTGCVYGQGGGIYVEGSNPRLDNLIVKNNHSTNFGGGMHIVSSPELNNIIIKNNSADELGGGIYIGSTANPSMNNVQITHNNAVHGGGIFINESSNTMISNSLIANNFESSEIPNYPIFDTDGYAAIEIRNAAVELNYCTIANNQGAGILLREGSNMNLSNSIYWFNDPIVFNDGSDQELDIMNISYSNIQNGYEGTGNIDNNPLFCNLSIFDYTLAVGSPCIGNGQNNSNIGALDVGCDQPNSNWSFSISDPNIQISGGDDEWNPGESLYIEMDFCNNSGTGHMLYPGVVLEVDTNLVSVSNDYFWFYGMDANSCDAVSFDIIADPTIILDTLVTFTVYPEALNCQNQPEFCIYGDTLTFQIPIVWQGALSSQKEILPLEVSISQNHPNPFNPITTIRYNLSNYGLVNISIYDMNGKLVKTLLNQSQTAGYKSIQWNSTNNKDEPVSAGLYLYIIQTGKFMQSKKMLLLK